MCSCNCCDSAHRDELNNFCTDISTALLKAVDLCETGKVVSKVVWSKELSELKKASLEAHHLWVCAGRPCSGQINCD